MHGAPEKINYMVRLDIQLLNIAVRNRTRLLYFRSELSNC